MIHIKYMELLYVSGIAKVHNEAIFISSLNVSGFTTLSNNTTINGS